MTTIKRYPINLSIYFKKFKFFYNPDPGLSKYSVFRKIDLYTDYQRLKSFGLRSMYRYLGSINDVYQIRNLCCCYTEDDKEDNMICHKKWEVLNINDVMRFKLKNNFRPARSDPYFN